MVANFWRPGVSDKVYPSRDDAVAAMADIYLEDVAALVDAGVTWIQLDSLAYWSNIDPELAELRRVTDLAGNMTRTINTDNLLIRAAREKNPDVTVAMHFCHGNMRSAWAAKGGYEPIAERVFGEVEVDRFLLEYDTDRSGGSSRCGSCRARPWCWASCPRRTRGWSPSTICAGGSTRPFSTCHSSNWRSARSAASPPPRAATC
ncbi:hypothetical protein BCD48_32200 [Pseudofrankia sp. BMG5.36]|nr:hypothetical protein BCD48_32200 [Pseudofrankia sp. BMG5.36]